MKLMTVMGTRPEIIRLSVLLKDIKNSGIDNVVVYTNQNFNDNLSTIFLKELDVAIDYFIDKLDSFDPRIWTQHMYTNIEKIILKENPDVFLILGDTYSGLSVDVAKKYQIPIVHMEAGNRSFDINMPEEQNRIHIDHQSNFLLPYTNISRENLLKEGIDDHNIFVFGNPIVDVLNYYKDHIDNSSILNRLKLEPKDYFLVTIHRAENTNDPIILTNILNGLNLISEHFNKKIIWGIHPRTKSKMSELSVALQKNIKIYDSFDFFDFVKLEKNAYLILTDSGTVQEEASLFNVPTVTIRENTERPETITCGSNILSGTKNADNILKTVKLMLEKSPNWTSPYINDYNLSTKIINFLKNTF